jgi:hypothetical protein
VEAGNNRARHSTGFGGRLALITTMTRVTRIPLLALFFVSAMEFILERARIDLVLMTGALTILLWGGARVAVRVVIALPNAGVATSIERPANILVIGAGGKVSGDKEWNCHYRRRAGRGAITVR